MDTLLSPLHLNQAVLNSLLEPAFIINKDGIIAAVNQSWLDEPVHPGAKIDGYAGKSFMSLFEDQNELIAGIELVLTAKRTSSSHELSLAAHKGDNQSFIVRSTPLKDSQSGIIGALVMFFNITAQLRLTQEMKSSADLYKLIADHSKDMIKVTDIQGEVIYASPSHMNILGYANENTIFEFIHPDDIDKLAKFMQETSQTRASSVLEVRKQHKNGDWIWLETACSPVFSNNGNIEKLVFISREIGERKAFQGELERMAFHDFLTGLYGRRKIRTVMSEALEEAIEYGEKLAILLMDLDKFKWINDTHGHDVGDIALKEFARRLLCNKRETDIAGRLSGDEFVVIMKRVKSQQDVLRFIQRFQKALKEPCVIHSLGSPIQINSSVGYSIYPDHGATVKELFKFADVALYKEKRKRAKE